MNEEEKQAIKEVKEIIDDYEYPSILNVIKKTNYGNKDLIELWNAIDDESSNYGEYSEFIIAKAIVYLVNLLDKQQKEIERLKKFEKYYENEKVIWQRKDYISKDKIKEIKEEYEKERANMTQIIFSKYGKTQQTFNQAVVNEVIKVLDEILGGK